MYGSATATGRFHANEDRLGVWPRVCSLWEATAETGSGDEAHLLPAPPLPPDTALILLCDGE
jgi:hypothetical protein